MCVRYFKSQYYHRNLFATCLLLDFVRYPFGEFYHTCQGLILKVEDVVHLYFRHHQSVAFCQWIDVKKGVVVIILRHLIAWDLPCYNL